MHVAGINILIEEVECENKMKSLMIVFVVVGCVLWRGLWNRRKLAGSLSQLRAEAVTCSDWLSAARPCRNSSLTSYTPPESWRSDAISCLKSRREIPFGKKSRCFCCQSNRDSCRFHISKTFVRLNEDSKIHAMRWVCANSHRRKISVKYSQTKQILV